MKCFVKPYMWAVIIPALFLMLTIGCSDSNKSNDTAKKSASSSSGNSDDESATASGSSTGSDSKNSSVVASNNGKSTDGQATYLPVLEKNLEQNLISSRMEKNFSIYYQKKNKADMHHFKSAGLRMFKPDSMQIAKNYTGFVTPNAGITVLTNPFSMAETTQNIISTVVNSPNSRLVFSKDIEVDGYSGTFYTNVETWGKQRVANFSLAFGDDDFSWVAKGSFDAKTEMKNNLGEDMLRAILSVRIADEPRLPPGEDVDFTIQPNILKLNDGFVDKLIFTKGGRFPSQTVDQPIFQALRVPKKVRAPDQQQFAQLMITPSPIFRVELISMQNEIEIDSLKGYEFVAIGQDSVSREPLQMYAVTLYDNDVAYVMNGWVSSLNTDNHVQDFKQLARTFRRKAVPEVQTDESATESNETVNGDSDEDGSDQDIP